MKQLFILCFIVFIAINVYPLTLSEIRNEIRQQIGDASTIPANQHWSDSTLNTRINIVQTEIAEQTRCLLVRLSTQSISGQREYRYPSNFYIPVRIAYFIIGSTPTATAYRKLDWTSLGTLDLEIPYWENTTSGIPLRYYERGEFYGLYPKPSLSQSTTYAIQLDYIARPDNMVNDTDIPFNDNRTLYSYHRLIIYGVTIMCRQDEGRDTTALEQKYYGLIKKMNEDLRDRPDIKDKYVR